MASRRNSRDLTRRMTLSAMLLALMLILGYVEHMFPLKLSFAPGAKLGLSNSILIFAVYMLDAPTASILMTLKVVLSGFLFSGMEAMMYGLCGGIVSLTGMVLLSKVRSLPLQVVSVAGGILHNVGQIGLSMIILNMPQKVMMIYLMWLSGIGALCGFLTGVCAKLVMKHLGSAGIRTKGLKRGEGNLLIAIAAVIVAIFIVWTCTPRAAKPPDIPDVPGTSVFEDGGHALQVP